MTLRHWLSHLGIFAAFFGVALLITFPLVTQLGAGFVGFPYGDAYENARHMWWMTHALRTGQSLFFQPLLAYPDGIAGLTLQASPLMIFPGWLFNFVMPLPVAYNLQALLTLALNGWAMYGFAWALTERCDAAFLAGVVFMSYPTLQGHLGASHLNIIIQWGVPLYAWGMWRLTRSSSSHDVPAGTPNGASVTRSRASSLLSIAWVALAFLAVAWAHTIQIIYAVLPVTALFLLLALMRRDWRRLAMGIVAAGTGALLTLLWLLPLFADAAAYTDVDGAVRYSADLLAAVTPSFFHPLWGALPHTRTVLGINLDEGAGYVGLIAGLIALLGVWRAKAARPWLGLALVVYILSLGPLLKLLDQVVYFQVDGYVSAVTLPWAMLSQIPGLDLARTPGRFNLTTGFAVAVMVAFGAAWVLAHLRRRWLRGALVLLCAGLILLDYQTFAPLPMTRADIPQAIYDLRERDDVRAVFDIPWDNLIAAKDALYLQTAHQLPLIAGQVTRRTPVDPAKLTILASTFDPALLDEAGADIIVLHKSYSDDLTRAWMIRMLGEPYYEDDRFALFERPETAVAADFMMFGNLDNEFALYAPEPGWVDFDLNFTGGPGEIFLLLNDEVFGRSVFITGGNRVVPVYVPAGYSTLLWDTTVPCPTYPPVGLQCNTPNIYAAIGEEYMAGTGISAQFGNDIHLSATQIRSIDGNIEVLLAWEFAAMPIETHIRFVHLLDANGELIAQVDSLTGALFPGRWNEIVALDLPADLPAGDYRVEIGWYSLPDVAPIGERVEIGRVTR
jgi:hypothetical protein